MTEQDRRHDPLDHQDRREHNQGMARQQQDQDDEASRHGLRDQADKHYLLIRYIAFVVTVVMLIQIAEALGYTIGWPL